MNPIFIEKCLIGRRLRSLNATETRKLGVLTRKEYLAAREKHNQRATSRCISVSPERERLIVPLSAEDRAFALDLAQDSYPRRRNWDSPEPGDKTSVRDISHGRYSSRCKYTRWSYVPILKSLAIISRWGSTILYRHHSGSSFVPAPRGWYWDADANGLRLVSRSSPKDDFHPDSGDLQKGTNHLLHRAVVLRAQRRVEAAKARREKQFLLRHSKGVKVGLQDSVRAGNCQAGSLEFAKRHGLDANAYYAPAKLLQLEPTNERVKLAIAIAARRHALYVAAGAEVFYPQSGATR